MAPQRKLKILHLSIHEIRSNFNRFPVSFNDTQEMHSEFLKFRFAKASV